MAVPVLTQAQRAAALTKATAIRKERGAVLAALRDGRISLKELLERQDSVVGKIPARRLLESLPGIGKVRAGRLLAELGISESRRVRGLGANQRAAILARFQPTAH